MKRLVLLGGGHAHVEVLRVLAAARPAGVEAVLVSPDGLAHYSGLAPAWLAGRCEELEMAIDLMALCAAAGARWLPGRAVRLDARGRAVHLAGGASVAFDVASVDVGAAPAGRDLPGVAEHAFGVRPLVALRALADRLDALAAPRAEIPIAVVGAGAAGIEVALALDARARVQGARPAITLIDAAEAPLPGHGEGASQLAGAVLDHRGVRLAMRRAVMAVEPEAVLLAAVGGGAAERVPAAITVWATGAAGPPLVAASGLLADADGFMRVGDTLCVPDGPPVFGAGDAVSHDGRPWVPRCGAAAVRQGPVLAHNLLAALGGRRERRYRPRRHALALLDTSDGQALLSWGRAAVFAPWCLALKRRLDARWLARYRGLT